MLRAVARNALHTPRRAPPVTPDVLCHISKVLDFEYDPISCTLFCALLFTFFLMARLANIVPRSHKCFDPSRNLTRSDVATNQHGLIVTFKCTKTIQFGERQLHIPMLRLPGSPICPVSAYQRMVRLVPASSRPALFVLASHSGLTILTQERFITAFRPAISTAGPPFASAYRGHSFRRGAAASWAFIHGIPGELIQIYGDWASDAYKAYLEFSVESKLAFAQQLRSAVLSGTSYYFFFQCTVRFWAFRWVAERFIRHTIGCSLLFVRILNKLLSVPKSELCFICVEGRSWGIYPLWTTRVQRN